MLKSTLRTVLVTAMLAGVGAMTLSGAMAADKVKIGFILKFPGGFFDILKGGGKTFADAHPDVEMIYAESKSGTDVEGQIALIESMITQGVQGIAITPVDPAVATALDAWAGREGRAMIRLDYSGCGASEGRFADHTLAEAGSLIAKRLRDGRFVLNAQVSVTLLEVKSRRVSVLGQVAKGVGAADLRVGMEMQIAIEVLSHDDDHDSLVYVWEPVT